MIAIYSFLYMLLCIVLQVLIFNHLHLLGGVALIYVCMLVKLPVEWPRGVQILIGFLAGLCVDCFCNTPGMHALSGCTMMWMRVPLLHLFVVSDEVKNGLPGLRLLGMSVFLRYALTVISLYCIILYTVEALSVFHWEIVLTKILISILMTLLLSLVLELAAKR